MDAARLRASWSRVARHGSQVPQFFYARLFVAHPHLRELFPVSMAAQSDRLVGALGKVVAGVDDLAGVVPLVEQLGRDHRKFTVREDHFPLVGEALLATLAHFLEDEWTPALEADWTEAYGIIATTMIKAAGDAENTSPAWWDAEIVAHERRGFDIALVRLQPYPAYPYRAGQSVSLETPMRPRVWRSYSPANAPRSDGTIDLQVKAVPGGQVSNALVNSVASGDVVRLGAPVGSRLTLADDAGRDLLLLAGGTGLAPLKAIVEELTMHEHPRRISLFVGARTAPDLYDLPSLRRLEHHQPGLTVTPVLSEDPYYRGERGTVAAVALRRRHWHDHEVYVCGPGGMVGDAMTRLVAAGLPVEQVHAEDFDDNPYRHPGGVSVPTRAEATT